MELEKSLEPVHGVGMIDPPEIIAPRLVALRESTDLSQDKFAESIGISQPRWNQYETGKRPLTLEVASATCRKYKVTLDWLYFGDASGLPMRLGHLAKLPTTTRLRAS